MPFVAFFHWRWDGMEFDNFLFVWFFFTITGNDVDDDFFFCMKYIRSSLLMI